MQNQARIGAFIGFAPLSSLSLTDATSPLPGGTYRPASDNRAHISLRVPADAQVWFDGKATTQTGAVPRVGFAAADSRQEVCLRGAPTCWMKEGKPIEEKRRIKVEARDWLSFVSRNRPLNRVPNSFFIPGSAAAKTLMG